jgi:REP element-mobilizing transposase RayT
MRAPTWEIVANRGEIALARGHPATDDRRMSITPGTRALRRGRYSEPGWIYHVTTATHGRERLLATPEVAGAITSALRHEAEAGRCHTLAYVVMPDHLHWLLQLRSPATLSGTVNNMKAHSARAINALLNRRGPVWQSGFYDHALRRDEHLRMVARYIVANPVRAGLVERIDDYPFWNTAWGRFTHRDL